MHPSFAQFLDISGGVVHNQCGIGYLKFPFWITLDHIYFVDLVISCSWYSYGKSL